MARMMFLLKSGDVDSATRCFHFAKVAHGQGHEVHLFLVDHGVVWADKTKDFSEKTLTGDCPADFYPYLEENEIPVGVCPPCAAARKIDEARFFSNMVLSGAPPFLELAAQGTVLTF